MSLFLISPFEQELISSLCPQGSDLLYEVEVPGPPTVLALNNGDGGNRIFYIHITK